MSGFFMLVWVPIYRMVLINQFMERDKDGTKKISAKGDRWSEGTLRSVRSESPSGLAALIQLIIYPALHRYSLLEADR